MSTRETYKIGSWTARPLHCELARNGQVHHLEPKVMQLLVLLAENPGEVMTREELQDAIWEKVVVSDHALTRLVSQLRATLDEPDADSSAIETIPKTGYRLIAPVQRIEAEGGVSLTTDVSKASKRRVPLLIVGSVIVASVISVMLLVAEPKPPVPPGLTVLSSDSGIENFPSLSPSGGIVVFSSDLDGERGFELSLVSIDGEERRQLTAGPGHDAYPRWSASGEQVRYLHFQNQNDCEMRSISVVSDQQSTVQPCPDGLRHGWDWASNEDLMVFSESREDGRHSRIRAYDQRTGRAWDITEPAAGESDLNPLLSPDRRHVAFIRSGSTWDTSLWVASMNGKDSPTRLSPRGYSLAGMAWMSDSRGLVFSSNMSGRYQIWQVRLNDLEPRWLPIPGIHDPSSPIVFDNGNQMLVVDWDYDFNLHLLDLSADEESSPLFANQRWDFNPIPGPDGTRIAFISNRSGTDELWLADMDGSNQQQLTRMRGLNIGHFTWLPDGSTIIFAASEAGEYDIYRAMVADGSVSRLTDGGDNLAPSVALDGSGFYFASRRSGDWQIYFQDLAVNGDAVIQVTHDGGYHGREIPTGGFIYSKPHGDGLFHLTTPESAPVKLAEGYEAYSTGAWDHRDGFLYFLGRDSGHSLAVMRQPLPEGKIELVRSLNGRALSGLPGFRLSPDGQKLWLSVADSIESEIVRIDGLELR